MGAFFRVLIEVNDWLITFLFPGVPNIFENMNNLIDTYIESGYLAQLQHWLGIIFYFIPLSFVRPLLIVAFSLATLRLVFAIIRLVSDFLK